MLIVYRVRAVCLPLAHFSESFPVSHIASLVRLAFIPSCYGQTESQVSSNDLQMFGCQEKASHLCNWRWRRRSLPLICLLSSLKINGRSCWAKPFVIHFAKAFSCSVMANSWQLFLQQLEGKNAVRLLFQGILKACVMIIVFQYWLPAYDWMRQEPAPVLANALTYWGRDWL